LTQDCSEEKLRECFEQHGNIERVKKIKDYAFVHFEDRACAVKVSKFQGFAQKYRMQNYFTRFNHNSWTNIYVYINQGNVSYKSVERSFQAMRELNGKEMGGSHIEVSLAKPPSDKKKKEEMLRARERRMMQTLQLMQSRGGYDNALYDSQNFLYIIQTISIYWHNLGFDYFPVGLISKIS
jgi:heterogeneous nuclear ribonucleoprotein R